ncbi:hypothetical protein [Paenibacillus oryzae]|nr:hypothetical protein [Paenibacillus oryzae]
MIMRLFASKYPADVMGIILVDSTHEKRFSGPDFSKFRRMEQKKHRNLLRLGYLLSPIAVPRLIKRHIGAKRLPFNIQQIVNALGYRNNAYKAAYLEFLSILESAEQLHKSQPLKSEMPIIVLSAGRQSKEWIETQKELLKLTMNTKHFVVGESWHSIHIHHPQAVIDSVICLLSDGKS